MAIEDDIVALLHSPEVQKIRFVAEAVRIGGTDTRLSPRSSKKAS
jgi:hypothetical protein